MAVVGCSMDSSFPSPIINTIELLACHLRVGGLGYGGILDQGLKSFVRSRKSKVQTLGPLQVIRVIKSW